MDILVAVWGARSQFSPMLDRLARRHRVSVMAPIRDGVRVPGVVAVAEPPPTSGDYVECTRRDFEARQSAFAAAMRTWPGRADVVFAQASFGGAGAAAQVLGVPVVAHVELPGMELAGARSDFPLQPDQLQAHEILTGLVLDSLRRSAGVITPSAHSKSLLPDDLHARTTICMEGFEAAAPPTPRERSELRVRFGLPPDRPVVAIVGRTLEAVRGFDVFAGVAARLADDHPRPVFLAVGHQTTLYGNERRYLGRETFVEWSLRRAGLSADDIDLRPFASLEVFRGLVRCCDVVLLPLYEGAGTWSAFECLAQGVAVVAARSCFLPEVVRDGVNGLLADLGRPATFATAVRRLLGDQALRERLGVAAARTIARRHAPAMATATYERALAAAASRG